MILEACPGLAGRHDRSLVLFLIVIYLLFLGVEPVMRYLVMQVIDARFSMAKATFAAGCYWGVEAAFRQLPGVSATRVGFIGGATEAPSYRDVCSGRTGHAEAVEVEFNPETIAYGELLAQFWDMHDPTTLNRQGWDVGDQYRSAIFTHSPEQEAAARAEREKQDATGRFRDPIVTEIVAATVFTPAHEDHQRYLEKRGMVPSLT